MSQYGAYGYALHGASFQQILAHYYPGTTLAPAPATKFRVLLADRKKKVSISSEVPFTVADGAGRKVALPAGTVTLGAEPDDRRQGADRAADLSSRQGRAADARSRRTAGRSRSTSSTASSARSTSSRSSSTSTASFRPRCPPTWSAQALEAQAVASRSYALATRQGRRAVRRVLGHAQPDVSRAVSPNRPAATAAVNATKGQVLSLRRARSRRRSSTSTSGGETESSLDWTGTSLPYLVAVPDPYDSISPYHNWGPVPVTAQTISKALKVAGPDHRRDDDDERRGPRRQAHAHDTARTDERARDDAAHRDRPALDVVHGRRHVASGAGAGSAAAVRLAAHAHRHVARHHRRHARVARHRRHVGAGRPRTAPVR